MRKLATIEKIIDIQPIPNADAIEVATVRGWKVVVKKNEFIVGDLVVYLEVDSWVPMELAPFLVKEVTPKEYNGVKGERLRTVRLRGQISQGLILPISVLEVKTDTGNYFGDWSQFEGYDVTALLGIQLWSPPVPACLSGVVKGPWPSSIPKTDQERIQNLKTEYDELRKHTYQVEEKMDGSSCTMFIQDEVLNVCSRNLNLRETEGNTFWATARKYEFEGKVVAVSKMLDGHNIAIQAELCGPGVQGNKYKLASHNLFVFDIFDITTQTYVDPKRKMDICTELGIQTVPVVGVYPLAVVDAFLGQTQMDTLIAYADGKSLVSDTSREGVVFKRVDGPEHFKVISNKFLLCNGND